MPGRFVVKKGSTGKFRFNLLSTNGQVVATSEAYNSKAAALKGVESVRRLAADAVLVDETVASPSSGPVKKAAAKKATKTARVR